jgi:hypothetical protein
VFFFAVLIVPNLITQADCTERMSSLCACELQTRGPALTCDNFGNLTQLIRSLENERVKIYRLRLRNIQQPTIGDDAFGGLLVNQIDLSNNPTLTNVSLQIIFVCKCCQLYTGLVARILWSVRCARRIVVGELFSGCCATFRLITTESTSARCEWQSTIVAYTRRRLCER